MKYQFQIDGRAFGSPIRTEWRDAAQDAVSAGYASWNREKTEIHLSEGAMIARIEELGEVQPQ